MTPQFAAEPRDLGLPARFWRGQDVVTLALLASLALHIALGLAILWQRQLTIAPPEQESVPVDLVTPEEYEAETRPAAPATPPGSPAESGLAGMVHATAMLSAAALASPKSAQARAVLPHLAGDERAVQICNLEAMEQVKAWKPTFDPERIVAYASSEVSVTANAVRTDGAAFLSGGEWYRLRYACGLSNEKVVSFDFQVGDTIPHDEWDAHHLPTAD
ncbi:MAG TPA: DUF930 domain-containing protein [Bauldia sp.]|nr:DUF930 domain-containing protein [Bauldia sp.]